MRSAILPIIILIAVISSQAGAAEFSIISSRTISALDIPDKPVTCNVRLTGMIEKGDLKRMKQAILGISEFPYLHGKSLCLNSSGGSYDEALKIARTMLEEGIWTIIEDGAECYSACALIFMAGTWYEEGRGISRFLHVRGKLGFHSPYFGKEALADRTYSRDDLQLMYRSGIAAIRKLMKIGKGLHVSRNMMPSTLMAEMLERGPDELFTIKTVFDAQRFKIDLWGGRMPKRPSIEMLCNACVNRYIDSTDDEPPASCGDSQHPINYKKRRNLIWFADFGGEGAGYCVVRQNRQKAPELYWDTVWSRKERLKKYTFFRLNFWMLHPPKTPISNLAGD